MGGFDHHTGMLNHGDSARNKIARLMDLCALTAFMWQEAKTITLRNNHKVLKEQWWPE